MDKLNNLIEFLSESRPIRVINALGGMSGVYESEEVSETDEYEIDPNEISMNE